jgi:hypothetical protein
MDIQQQASLSLPNCRISATAKAVVGRGSSGLVNLNHPETTIWAVRVFSH